MEHNFKIGDKVLSGNSKGTIKMIYPNAALIEFDDKIFMGHNGGGFCKDGHGANIPFEKITKLSEYKPSKKPNRDLLINEDDELNLQIALNTAKSFNEFLELV